jgi:nucleotide-binding universal stress UspA family protein
MSNAEMARTEIRSAAMVKLLCATDGSSHSVKAVSYAADIAKRMDASLTYIAVNPVLLSRGTTARLWDDAEVQRMLDKAAKMAKDTGIKNVKCVRTPADDVAGAIVEYAQRNDVDQIIVGSGGKGAAARFMIGSVSLDVVTKAACAVTVVH